MPAPTHRLRSKSAPRGRSPDPRSLKRAAEKSKAKSKEATGSTGFVTPPPKVKGGSPASSSTSRVSAPKQIARKISFGGNVEYPIRAENDAPKSMEIAQADAILNAIKDP